MTSNIDDLLDELDVPTPAPDGSPDAILDEAYEAATEAAIAYLNKYGDRADCGLANVVIDDARTKFVRHLKAKGIGKSHWRGGWQISLCGGMRVQSRIIYEKACCAFIRVLDRHSISAHMDSWAD